MRFQTRSGYCGAGVVVNMARALGQRVSEARVRALSGTDASGTDATGIMVALRGLGYTATEFNEESAAKAWLILHGSLTQGKPVVLSVDNDWHWVACVGDLGERVVTVDSSRVVKNMCENGVHVLDRRSLLRRWRSSTGTYYGIVAGKASR